jgi:phage replication O-like protein O
VPKGDIKLLKADPEDGTTPIARLFLDALPMTQLSGLELRCVLHLWRETYGWRGKDGKQLKQKQISLPEWVKHTNAAESRISKALSMLVQNKIFKREMLGMGKGYIYEMNTHISDWNDSVIDKQKLAQLIGIENKSTLDQNATLENKSTLDQKEGETLDRNRGGSLENKSTLPDTKLGVLNQSLNKYLYKKGKYINNLTGECFEGVETFSKEAGEIWTRVLARLKPQVSQLNFQSWLEKTTGLGYHQQDFIVGVNNNVISHHLTNNMQSLLEKTLIEVSEKQFQICFLNTVQR